MFLPGTARLMLARGLMHRWAKARVAAPAPPAAGNGIALVGLRKLENLIPGFVVIHDRSDRNFEHHVAAVAASLVRTFAVATAFGFMLGIEAEVHQGIVAFAGFHDDVAALATVAAGGTPPRDKLLPAKGHAAIAAVSGLDPNFRLIDKHGGNRKGLSGTIVFQNHCYPERLSSRVTQGIWFFGTPPESSLQTPQIPRLAGATIPGKSSLAKNESLVPKARLGDAGFPPREPFRQRRRYSTSMGSTITNLPICPLFRNLMRPVILAKRVSSLPRPTFSPGFTRVPRCRTMMVPPGTTCPPNALNPSRCAFESRPFREVPCPFLCAIRNPLNSKRRHPVGGCEGILPSLSYFFFEGDFFAAFFGAAFFLVECFLAFA